MVIETNGSYNKLDHVVYGVTNLTKAINNLESRLGIKAVIGGRHEAFGTKNALFRLQKEMYFELLAIDESNLDVALPRWMGIDLLTTNKIIRWAITSSKLRQDAQILEKYSNGLGNVLQGSRKLPSNQLLKWELTAPKPTPKVEVVPFCIDWSMSETHPSEQLPISNCELLEMYVQHPKPEVISNIFEQLGVYLRVEKSEEIGITAKLKGPSGTVIL